MCMIEWADETYRVWNKVQRAARKPHRCDECYREIGVGEMYQYVTGLHSGGWDTWHTCAHCAWASEWLMKQCRGYLHGGVLEDLEEHWHEDPLLATLDLGRRIVGMRRKWKGFSTELLPLERLA